MNLKELFNKLMALLLPPPPKGEDTTPKLPPLGNPQGGRSQQVLNRLFDQFREEMANETTTESLMYHTCYTVYIKDTDYDRVAPRFARTVRDAINIFIRELREIVKNYPDYQNHSKYWTMQLVSIPQDAQIDGISADLLAENPIIIRSKLYPDDQYNDSRMQDEEHYVTTIHTKDSSKQMPTAINLAALKGLTELAKDKYRVEFNLNDTLNDDPKSEADRPSSVNKIDFKARLHIVDGDFITGDRTYRVYNMSGDKLLVSGKNGSGSNAPEEIRINDESVLNPTLEINRDKNTGAFSVKAWGDVRLGGRKMENGVEQPLPPNSSFMINGDYQIDFTTK